VNRLRRDRVKEISEGVSNNPAQASPAFLCWDWAFRSALPRYVLCVYSGFSFQRFRSAIPSSGFFLPWFTPLGWHDLLNCLIEEIVGGWYIALFFGTLHNFVVARFER
jgi:hypothetical protein